VSETHSPQPGHQPVQPAPRGPIEVQPLPRPLPPTEGYDDEPTPHGELSSTQARVLTMLEQDRAARHLLLFWCIWLLGSWLPAFLDTNPVPIRWMAFAVIIGMMLLWPAYRLTQGAIDHRAQHRRRMGALRAPHASGREGVETVQTSWTPQPSMRLPHVLLDLDYWALMPM